jgi:pimeloyl-ACP methyl ester carboxylesterase
MSLRHSLKRRILQLLACGIGGLLIAITVPSLTASAESASGGCQCPRVIDDKGQPLKIPPHKQPVLLVHGWGPPGFALPLGNPSQWDGDGGLATSLDPDKYVVGRLDYSDVHANWVADNGEQSIAKMIATAIKCMAVNSKKKVIVVGHSMGGLAIQAALANDDGAADNTAGIVSLATPWQGVPKQSIDNLVTIAKLLSLRLPFGAALPVQFYIDTVQNGSAVKALEADDQGNPSSQIKALKKIPAGIPVLPMAGAVTAPASDDLQKRTLPTDTSRGNKIPLSDLPTGQRVNLIGTTTTTFDQKRAALTTSNTSSAEMYDPIVSASSAQTPNAIDILPPITLSIECNVIDLLACANYHSALPSDPAFARAVLPTIESWTTSGTLAAVSRMDGASTSLGNCASKPTPTPVPTPPQQRLVDPQGPPVRHADPHCDDNEYLEHGKCKLKSVDCDRNQISDGHDGCKDKPQDCRPGQVRLADGDCYDEPDTSGTPCRIDPDGPGTTPADCGTSGSGPSNNGECPNGMIRVAPATEDSSGCMVPPGGQKEHLDGNQAGTGGNSSGNNGQVPGAVCFGGSGCGAGGTPSPGNTGNGNGSQNNAQLGTPSKSASPDSPNKSSSSAQPSPSGPKFVCLGGASCSTTSPDGNTRLQAPTSTATASRPTSKSAAPSSSKPPQTTTTTTPPPSKANQQPDRHAQTGSSGSSSVQRTSPQSSSTSANKSGKTICPGTGRPPPAGRSCPAASSGSNGDG